MHTKKQRINRIFLIFNQWHTLPEKNSFVFSPLCPRKRRIFGIFECDFRASDVPNTSLTHYRPFCIFVFL